MTVESTVPASELDVQAIAIACARLADEKKARDIEILDVERLLYVTGYFLVATVDSGPQARAVAHEMQGMAMAAGLRRPRHEVDRDATWALLDFGDLVVHLFQPEARVYYTLETLWSDAPRVAWQEKAAPPKPKPAKKLTAAPTARPKKKTKAKAKAKAPTAKPKKAARAKTKLKTKPKTKKKTKKKA